MAAGLTVGAGVATEWAEARVGGLLLLLGGNAVPGCIAFAISWKAAKRAQCCKSTFSLLPQLGFEVLNMCLEPMISPSKKVVNVGWSSVSPGVGRKAYRVSDFINLFVWRIYCEQLLLTLYAKVPTQERFGQIHVFDLDLDVIDLTIALLRALEPGTGFEKGRCCCWWELFHPLESVKATISSSSI